MNLDATIRMFRELGRNKQAEELLQFYIDNRNEPQKYWNLSEYAFAGDVKDPAVRAAITAKFKSFGKTEVAMAELLEAMESTGKGWNIADVDAIAVLPVAEYKKLFKAERGRKLKRIVSGGLLAKRVADPTPGMSTIAESTVAALREIAAESAINARRIANFFGIDLDPEAPNAHLSAKIAGVQDEADEYDEAGVPNGAAETMAATPEVDEGG